METISIEKAITLIKNDKVIAYPTEGVFGLGCDPDSEKAIKNILKLKNRPRNKGLILIADDIIKFDNYINWQLISKDQKHKLKESAGKHITFLVPCSEKTHKLISGYSNKVAIRITKHKTVVQICKKLNKPIISTSANTNNNPAAITHEEIKKYFKNAICCVTGELGGTKEPSSIIDLITEEKIR